MRIAQIVPSLDVGGLERLAVDLSVAERNAGHDPVICCIHRTGVLAMQASDAGIPVVCFEKRAGFSWATVWRLAQELRRRRVEVVHTHNALIHHYGVLAAHLAGALVVVNSWHGLGSLVNDHRLARIYRTMLPLTDQLVAVSDHTRSWLEKHFPRSPSITTIRNGIRLEPFSNLRSRPGVLRPKIRFGTVGRMVPIKNQKMLIVAFSRVYRRFPGCELHLAGDGPLRGELENTANSLDLRDSVHFHGECRDVANYLANLDIFVLSSDSEALPLVILEAMAAGLPIITTRVGGIQEVAPEGKVASYCSPGDDLGLAERMEELATVSDLELMGRHASEMSSRFSVSTMLESYESLFRDLVCRKRKN